MTSRLLCILLLFAIHVKGFSQNNPYNEVSIASPTAASLGKYADVPVSAHTGIPQISIPIYTVKEGPLSLPISVSYHAGGIKVLETASWVGTGWSLNAGGVITRSVQGTPDEKQTSSVNDQTHGYLSDSGYNKYLWVHTESPLSGQSPPRNPFYWLQDWKKFAEGKKDGEPDLFFFNFAGNSGKFFIRDDGKPVVIPNQDINIEYDYTPGYTLGINSFTITTPDGTKYHFGRTTASGDTDPVEKTNPISSQGGLGQGHVISSWYLNKIVSADNVFSITLTYQPENYGFYTISMFPVKFDALAGTDYSLIKNKVSGVRLSQIIFSNGKVDFNASTVRQDLNDTTASFVDNVNTQAKALDNISIYDSTVLTGKKFVFTYNYFIDSSSSLPGWFSTYGFTVDKKRLKLLSLQEQSLDGSIAIPPHQFDYFTDFVPRRLCFGIDHWGFYNGVQTNSDLIPAYTINDTSTVAGADRDAHWPYMRAGTLNKITYPTKGSTVFDFENNTTWVSYLNRNWLYQFGPSAGYDGSTAWFTTTQAFSGNLYKVNFANPSSIGSQAFLEIYRVSDNYQMGGWVLEPQQSISIALAYAEGDYLIKIKKLTQGYTGNGATANFYELDTVHVQKNEIVGGLRLKTITQHDAIKDSNNIITRYGYEVSGQSTGILYSRPSYVYKVRNDIYKDVGLPSGDICPMTNETGGCPVCGGSWYFKSGSGIRPMGTSQGNHIGYSEVKISQSTKGYSIKRFYGSDRWETDKTDVCLRKLNTVDLCPLTIQNFPFAPIPFEYKRGELAYEGDFNEAGQPVKENYYTYQYSTDPYTTPGLIAVYRPDWEPSPSGGSSGGPGTMGTLYRIQTKKKVQAEVNEIVYSQSSGNLQTVNITFFESAFHSQPTRKLTINSTGDSVITKYTYAFDFKLNSCDTMANVDALYYNDTAAATTEYFLYKDVTSTSTANYRFWSWQYYIYDLSQARNKYINARRATYSAVESCFTNSKAAADAWLKPILEMQSQNINAPIETSVWKAGKLLSASFNKYEISSSPSDAIYPSKIYTINLDSPSISFTPSAVSSNSITKDSRYQEESSALFMNGNIVEITPKNGVKISYLWGYRNTLPIAKAVGSDYANLNSAYTQSSYILSQLRTNSLLSAALVNTYTYHPIIGMTSESDPNGKTISYEYDKMQRMVLVRDQNNYILKKICYGYAGQPGDCNVYYNIQNQGSFTKNNCSTGYSGTQVTYTVPAGTYASGVSQADADTQAQNDVAANGQAYANANGTCVGSSIDVQGYNGKSVPYNVKFTNPSTGAFYIFSLPANTYDFSLLGQVPAETYTVQFYKTGVPATATFVVNGYTQSGNTATFYNISVNATTSAYMY